MSGKRNKFFPNLLDTMKNIHFNEIKNLSEARAKARNILKGLVEHEGTLSFIIMNVGIRPDKKIGWMCNVETLQKYYNSIADFPTEITGKQYTGPASFIGGTLSDYIA